MPKWNNRPYIKRLVRKLSCSMSASMAPGERLGKGSASGGRATCGRQSPWRRACCGSTRAWRKAMERGSWLPWDPPALDDEDDPGGDLELPDALCCCCGRLPSGDALRPSYAMAARSMVCSGTRSFPLKEPASWGACC